MVRERLLARLSPRLARAQAFDGGHKFAVGGGFAFAFRDGPGGQETEQPRRAPKPIELATFAFAFH